MTAQDAVRQVAILRGQLASFRSLLALSVVIASSRDETEILRVATTAVPSLGGCRVEAVYLDGAWHVGGPVGHPVDGEGLAAQLAALDRSGGSLRVDGAGWVWGYPLVGLEERAGHLVVSCENEPESDHQFLLEVLVQQAGIALANARLHTQDRASTTQERDTAARERNTADALRTANLALEQAMTQLARSSAAVQRSLDIHHRLTAVATAGEGPPGIARALHELTGLAVAIDDRHGNLITWAGPDQPAPYPKPTPARREQTVRRARQAWAPVRDKDRLVALAQAGGDVLGVIALIDPDRTAGDSEKVALEHATTVLTLELAHLQSLGETELRLRRDLVEELLAGTDPHSAHDRARALGYDLARPHRVVLVTHGRQRGDDEALYQAVRHAVRVLGVSSLLAARPGGVAVICDADLDGEQFRAAMLARAKSPGNCRVGVGAPCTQPAEFPRSHRQAELALKVQIVTGCPEQVTVFDDLGVYQLLSEIPNLASVDALIRRWLGKLLDYDTNKTTQLIDTLWTYLDCGGNYDLTAAALSLHRSTLRYRLQRIRELSGHDLNNPDTRFNLQLATCAWKTVQAMRQQP